MALILGQISYQSLKSILNFLIGIKIWKPSLVLKISEVISYLSFGGFQIGERMVDYFNSNIDKIIIGRFLGTIALGYYNIAFNLLLYPIQLINPIFTKVYFPYFSKIQSNIDLLKEKYLELIKTITFITFPIFIMLIPLSPALIPILYGEQWSQSIIIIQLLAIAGLSISQGNPIGSLLLAKGYAKQGFFWNLFLVPVYMIGLSLSANYFGLNGFAMGKTIITTMMFGFGYLYLIRRCLGNCFIEYIWNFTPFIVFSVIGAILISFISLNSLYYQLLLQLIVGGGFYLILVFIFDKKFVKNFITTYFKF
jgi:O-antigen/teichoic acid export membrane protein